METFISSAEKKGETPEILLSLVFSASFREVSASLSDDSIASVKKFYPKIKKNFIFMQTVLSLTMFIDRIYKI